jgi:hypothetical protein
VTKALLCRLNWHAVFDHLRCTPMTEEPPCDVRKAELACNHRSNRPIHLTNAAVNRLLKLKERMGAADDYWMFPHSRKTGPIGHEQILGKKIQLEQLEFQRGAALSIVVCRKYAHHS